MTDLTEVPTGVNLDLVNIALNSQTLCLAFALRHIAKVEEPEEAEAFKSELLEALRNGSINMALLEDAAIFDTVVGTVEQLTVPSAEEISIAQNVPAADHPATT